MQLQRRYARCWALPLTILPKCPRFEDLLCPAGLATLQPLALHALTTIPSSLAIGNEPARHVEGIMAEEEHVARLKQGVEAWNVWRHDSSCARPDLRGADLQHTDLVGANLSAADLCHAGLRGADLSYASLIEAQLFGADLRKAHLRGTRLRGADLRRANLGEADLSYADLLGADLRGADLSGADLHETDLGTADLADG